MRLTTYLALISALVLTLRAERSIEGAAQQVDAANLAERLARHDIGPGAVVVTGDTALDPIHRDWLAATGAPVSWGDPLLTPTAISIEPTGDPAGGWRVAIAAPAGAIVRLADSLGPIDSSEAVSGGISIDLDAIAGELIGQVGPQRVRQGARPAPPPRRVVVFGRASWETRFVITALEERGWPVDARITIGPRDVSDQGTPETLDTAYVAAVVALDGTATGHRASIERFVRDGGGLILGPDAAGRSALASLRVGPPGVQRASGSLTVEAERPRFALPLTPITRLTPNAAVLERRAGMVAMAAHRFGAGRVLQSGYHDTWRWRMTGPEGSVEAYRAWWSALVRTVAYQPGEMAPRDDAAAHDAPVARMAARFGPPQHGPVGAHSRKSYPEFRVDWLLGAVALASLLIEWASRRLRGLR